MKIDKDNALHLIHLLRQIDKLIKRLEREDQTYGDLWQNFADATKTPYTKDLMKMIRRDIKEEL